MDQNSFARAAVERIQDYDRTGARGQLTYVRLDKLKEVYEKLGVSEKRNLLAAVGSVLKSHSLGGATAGQVDESNFACVHGENGDHNQVNMEVEAAGAGMSEDQAARALVHTMQQFCTGKARVAVDRLSDSLYELMQNTVETVRFIKDTTKRCDFDLVFMPICDLRLGRVHHFEALSRFRDQARAKTTFQIITLAEELGLIVDFDLAFLRQTMEILNHMGKRGTLPPLAINVSSLSLA